MEESQTELKELRGTEVILINGKEKIKAYVAHADPNLGLTMHSMECDREVFCINKKSAMANSLRYIPNREKIWLDAFEQVVQWVKEGKVWHVMFSGVGPPHFGKYNLTKGVSHTRCAFK